MGRGAKIDPTKRDFRRSLVSAFNLSAAVDPFLRRNLDNMIYEDLHFEQARKILGLAFLGVTAAWEEFLDGCFIRYLVGAKSPNGFSPSLLLGPCHSMQHAYQLLGGADFNPESRYLDWTDPSSIIKKARVFFRNGRPFDCLEGSEQLLKDAVRIRNRVAHQSDKARNDFYDAALRILGRRSRKQGGRLRQGYSVGQLLTETPKRFYGEPSEGFMVLHLFLNAYWNLARQIAPADDHQALIRIGS